MRGFRMISQTLMLIALGLTLFDLVYQWVGFARVKIRTVAEVWTDLDKAGFEVWKKILLSATSTRFWETFSNAPAPVVLLVMATFFYAVSRILFTLDGGGRAARLE